MTDKRHYAGRKCQVAPYNVDDAGATIAPGQRCRVIEGGNELVLDRVMMDAIKRFMDEQALKNSEHYSQTWAE